MENFGRELETRGKKLHYTIHKLDYITIPSFYIIKRVKRNPHTRGKYFSTHINGKGFKLSIIFKRIRNKEVERRQGRKREREKGRLPQIHKKKTIQWKMGQKT